MNNTRELKKIAHVVKKINALRPQMQNMTDEELRQKASDLRERRETEADAKLLPEAFALVREATRRAIGKEHYDVQIMGGIVLSQGRIAEAKTGEGKTITIYLPAFLEALYGKGVHVVTVNDYLAHRDATEAAKVFDMLGMTVGCVLNSSTPEERQTAYQCDITYVTNTELGFDYLRDHTTYQPEHVVLRGLNYAIIDEVDSVLIDEAKTPLIISGHGPDSEDMLTKVDEFVRHLKEGEATEVNAAKKLVFGGVDSETGDFIKQEKENRVYLTEKGIEKVEHAFQIQEYGDPETLMLQRSINNALRAHYLMQKDTDYILRDGKVEIVDTFTGRVLPGRRFSNGLHQAIEAKEHVEIQKENITIATVTFQAFFNKFNKKAGLTGTAMTSMKEFKDVYHLDIVEIPTNKPVIRQDLNDAVFRTKQEKWDALIKEVEATHKTGQPVLIGTSNVEDSEIVSTLLSKHNIEHNTLNAKNEALEAEIIAQAGQFGAVTVATNMAGRGTDILLDQDAKSAGGLKVIGTERHDSRRIDNQLKGRSGRQGDPGSSQFFISLEDRIMRVFGDKNSLDTLMMITCEYGQPIQYAPLTKIIEKAQQAVETENRLVRENMIKYEDSNNEHREQIYGQREEILTASPEEIQSILHEIFNDVSDEIVDAHFAETNEITQEKFLQFLQDYFRQFVPCNLELDMDELCKKDVAFLRDLIHQVNGALISAKEQELLQVADVATFAERSTILKMTDMNWSKFLNSMEYVKANIGSQAYGQKDPAMEYKKKGVELFNIMIENIKKDVASNFMHIRVSSN